MRGAYQGDDFAFDSIGGEKAESIGLELDTAKAPISIDVGIREGKPVFIWEYRADMYTESTIAGLAECMSTAAKNFIKKTWIKEVSILSETAEKEMQSFNATDYPVELKPVHKLFEAQVEKNPKSIACIAAGERITYEELNIRANKVAEALINKGIDIGEAVGMILPRTTDVPAVEYGIMKAGGVFLPMLPDYPDDRIDYCLKDAKSRFVVTTKKIKEIRQKLFEEAPYVVITMEEIAEDAETGMLKNPDLEIPADSLAYIIYTSGSTGTPKGVMIEHRNLCNFVNANPRNYETLNFVSSGKTALAVAAISFDVSLMEMHIPLCNGMTVCIAGEEEIHNPLELFKLIQENEVNVITGTPSFVTSFIELPQASEALKNVKMYDIGAEAFPSALYQKIHKASPNAVIVNGYGPTETTISCTSKVMDGSGTVTIGRPAANVRAYICDKYGNILPKGVKGELVICGQGVGRGYVGLPEKTAEVFITLNGEQAYRSGDLVRYNEDGEIEFFGRLDNQVKLRGFRIELDEIENVMNQYPGMLQSVVLVKEDSKAGQILCGYFTATEKINKEKLIQHMKRALTYYMIPNVLTQMEEFPLTANGKINKKALPNPDFTAKEKHYNAPKTKLQEKICGIFANVLGLEQVGIDEDFFEIGGTSLSASKVAMKAILEELPISYGDIFDNPTVKELEGHVLMVQGKKEQRKDTEEKEQEVVSEGIDSTLKYNTAEYVDEITYTDIGDVLLTGATGFLGVHVLNELIKYTPSKVYCLVRKGKQKNIESRLKNLLVYYFSDENMDEMLGDRIIPIEGDITDKEVIDSLEDYKFKTVINCAASVKHFTNDDSLERINVEGVENLINLCTRTGRRLIHISTVSIAGMNINRKFSGDRKLHENELYFGQDISNKYINTKFRAEKAVLEAISEGRLDAKIIRVGNLMSRNRDGEFQANANTSGFMRILRAYAVIGKVPVSVLDEPIEFSPIDCTAAAVINLAGTNKKFTVFQACNGHNVEMGDVVEMLNRCGIQIKIVKDEEFMEAMNQALAAISLGTPVIYFLQLPAFIFGTGGSAQASVYLGKREIEKASEIFSLSIVAGGMISLIFCLIAPVTAHPIAYLLAGTPELEELLYPYILVYMLGIPILTVAIEFSYFFNVDNNLILGTIMFIMANIVNLILDYMFLKFTSLGTYGAAMSTIIGYMAGLLLLIPYTLSKKRMMNFKFTGIWKNTGCILETIKAGAPSGMFFIMMSLKDLILNSSVVRILGQNAMEIYSVCTNSVFIIELVAGGVVGMIQTICGILYGEKDYYGIRRVIRRVVLLCVVLTGTLMTLFMVFPQMVAGVFGYNNLNYMNMMLTCIRLFSLSFVFYALNKFFQVYYQTILMPVPAMLDTILQGFVVLIPVIFLFLYAKGIYGVCLGAACSELITLIILCCFVLLKQKHGKFPPKGLFLIPEKDNENYADITIKGEVVEGVNVSKELIQCCAEHGIDRKRANLIGVAAEEIAVNISQYGYKKGKRNYIDISLSETDEKLILRIRDDGVPFDPTQYHSTETDKFEIHGISLIKKVASNFSYSRVLNMNNTIIEINRR